MIMLVLIDNDLCKTVEWNLIANFVFLTLYCPSAVRLSSSTEGTVATRYESERPVWIFYQF